MYIYVLYSSTHTHTHTHTLNPGLMVTIDCFVFANPTSNDGVEKI